jgi:glyoxylase-like metal-dependent hydrolase (beta-lactamase superfamily II)
MSPLEDTWHDIILKAIRGLALDQKSLSQASGVKEEKIASLLQGFRNDATLVAIAPSLGLHPRELVMVARGASHPPLTNLPKNFQCFTSIYHGMEVHSYLLWSEQTHKAVAFDTGTEIKTLLKKLKEHQLDLVAIFLTHAHCDHVFKLSELQAKTEAKAWIDYRELLEGTQALPADFFFALDDQISIQALSTPGHSPGGTTYLITGVSPLIAVVGDAIFARSAGGMPPTAYTNGLKNICQNILMLPPSTLLAPAHGPLTTIEEERLKNPFFA